MHSTLRNALAFAATLLLSVPAFADPAVVPVQGVVTNTEGAPVMGAQTVNFRLYSDVGGANLLWTETQTIAFDEGFFSAELGTTNPLDSNVFRDNGTTYLGVRVGTDTEMELIPMGVSPYAAWADYCGDASTWGGMTPATFSVSWNNLTDVPPGFADGDDAAGAGEASWTTLSGVPADLRDGDQVLTEAQVDGYVANNGYLTSVRWTDIAGIPAGFADGVDDAGSGGGTYSAGDGLELDGTTFSVASDGITPTMLTGSASSGFITQGDRGNCLSTDDFAPNGTTVGLWVEDCTAEGGGLFMNGNILSMWSPGDVSRTIGGNSASGVIVEMYDEDSLGGTSPAPKLVFTSAGNIYSTNGARLVGGTWTNSSSRALKENFSPVDVQEILEGVMSLPIEEWNYIADGEEVRHLGPISEDFSAAFGYGDSDNAIATVDADGVALAAIQALYERVQELEAENAELESRLLRIEATLFGPE